MTALLFLRTAIAVLVIPPLLRLVPLERLMVWLGRGAGRRALAGSRQARVIRWVDGALRRLPPPWRRTCLTRSVVLYHLLRSGGVPVVLNMGVRKGEDGAVKAHAWLTSPPGPLSTDLEKGHAHEDFRVIAVFPPAPLPPGAMELPPAS